MSVTCPVPVFTPVANLLKVLCEVANDPLSHYAEDAAKAIKSWEAGLASPEQIAMVETNDELEVDDVGAGVSESERGFFIQTWTWVDTSP